MRLRENGLLVRQDRTASVLNLLEVMARTPFGSWAGSPGFGLRDLIESRDMRVDVPRTAMERINNCFRDLGLGEFTVTEFFREPGQRSGLDSYSVTIALAGVEGTVTTVLSRQQ